MTAIPKPNKMTSAEYLQTTETNRHTELWNGEVVNFASLTVLHQQLVGRLYSSILAFISQNKGTCTPLFAPLDVVIDETHVVQPDVMVVCDPSKLDNKCCHGAPDWVIEVTSTNRSDDFDRKFRLYKNAGVREYWIVDPKNEKTLVYFFEKNDLPDIYMFDTEIPVNIYDRKLSIRIADLV